MRPDSRSSIASAPAGPEASERLAVDDDFRVDAEHRSLAALDRARLPGRELEWIVAALFVLGRNHDERDVQLLEDRPPLRRDRRQHDRRSRRNAHPRLRAFQISSAGHFRAHSAEMKS